MSSQFRPKVVEYKSDNNDVLAYWTLESLADMYAKAPEEVVPGFVSTNLTMFQGTGGSGKSLIAADLTTAYTTGTKFLGKFDVHVNQHRPNVCYADQDNFSHNALRKRLQAFGCDSSKLFMPQSWYQLDDPKSIEALVTFVNHYRVGLLVLDSVHAFHKLRDGKLEYLRDAFKAVISAGTSVVLLSHITKSSRASEKGAAKGSGLLESTDYTFGMTEVEFGKFKVEPVKIREGVGEPVKEFYVTYSGNARPEQAVEVTLEDKILQFIADAGEKGTYLDALRTLAGKDNIKAAMANLEGKIYRDGKRGPGNHIWDLKYKPDDATDSSEVDNADDGNDGGLAAA
jgi:hypothetical protein